MKIPKRILPLIKVGIVDVYVVRCGSEVRCAKIYKEAYKRSFKQAVLYQEGRKVRNSRRARAMEKGSKFGRNEQEQVWQNAEVDALYRLADINVRVPRPYGCFDGVLIMELITDDEGQVAPRLNDVSMSAKLALEDHAIMMRYVTRMLCTGLVHGDLSEFNVLVDDYGPVIIDLPQAVDSTANNNARHFFERDVNKITGYYGLYAPELLETRYAREIWALYEAGDLHPEIELTGCFEESEQTADVDSVLLEIKAAMEEEMERQERMRQAG